MKNIAKFFATVMLFLGVAACSSDDNDENLDITFEGNVLGSWNGDIDTYPAWLATLLQKGKELGSENQDVKNDLYISSNTPVLAEDIYRFTYDNAPCIGISFNVVDKLNYLTTKNKGNVFYYSDGRIISGSKVEAAFNSSKELIFSTALTSELYSSKEYQYIQEEIVIDGKDYSSLLQSITKEICNNARGNDMDIDNVLFYYTSSSDLLRAAYVAYSIEKDVVECGNEYYNLSTGDKIKVDKNDGPEDMIYLVNRRTIN
ncbi:MAG: hypothetical protein LIO90_08740 [Bacteroidales bacterium]|nr:hypothetical protein [Bacteroidales bacterium]